MQSLFLAVMDIVTTLLKPKVAPAMSPKKKPVNRPKPPANEGQNAYRFCCWLCSGETAFRCRVPTEEVFLNLDCCRCGMENRVKIAPPPLNLK
jgi:transcription elongation factor Elf1